MRAKRAVVNFLSDFITFICTYFILGIPTGFGRFAKNLKITKAKKNSSKFVYILAKHRRSHFNLTNFLSQRKKKLATILL